VRYVILILAIAIAIPVFSPCSYGEAVPSVSVPHDRDSRVTLEARRVRSVNGDVMTYDLGRETITVKADSFASQRFLKDVKGGRTSARETVTLKPVRNSPFNKDFNAR